MYLWIYWISGCVLRFIFITWDNLQNGETDRDVCSVIHWRDTAHCSVLQLRRQHEAGQVNIKRQVRQVPGCNGARGLERGRGRQRRPKARKPACRVERRHDKQTAPPPHQAGTPCLLHAFCPSFMAPRHCHVALLHGYRDGAKVQIIKQNSWQVACRLFGVPENSPVSAGAHPTCFRKTSASFVRGTK